MESQGALCDCAPLSPSWCQSKTPHLRRLLRLRVGIKNTPGILSSNVTRIALFALASCAKWLARGRGRVNLLCLQVCLGKSAHETPLGGVYLPDLHQRPLKSVCPATADGEIMQVG